MNSAISQPMAQVINKALAKDPMQRYQTPLEMLSELSILRQKRAATAADDNTITTEIVGGSAERQYLPREEDAQLIGTEVAAAGPFIAESRPVTGSRSTERALSNGSSSNPISPSSGEELSFNALPGRKPSAEPAAVRQDEQVEEVALPSPCSEETPETTAAGSSASGEQEIRRKNTVWKVQSIVFILIVVMTAAVMIFESGERPPPVSPPSPSPSTAPPLPQSATVTTPRAATSEAKTRTDAAAPRSDGAGHSADSLVAGGPGSLVANPPEAQRRFAEAPLAEGNRFDTAIALARLLAVTQDYTGAIRQYQDVLRITKPSSEVYCELGSLQIAHGDCEAARPNIESCLTFKSPNKDKVLSTVAMCYQRTNRLEQAKLLFQEALDLNPNNQAARTFVAALSAETPQRKDSLKEPIISSEQAVSQESLLRPNDSGMPVSEQSSSKGTPETRKGHLNIKVDPPDARIYILEMKNTYHKNMEIAEGFYTVEVSRLGYSNQKKSIKIVSGQKNLSVIRLKKIDHKPKPQQSNDLMKTPELQTNELKIIKEDFK